MGERPTVLEVLVPKVRWGVRGGISYMDLLLAMPDNLSDRLGLNGSSARALAETWIHMAHAFGLGVVFERKNFDAIAKACALDSFDLRDNPPLDEDQLQVLFNVSLEERVLRGHPDVDGEVRRYVISYLLHHDFRALARMI